MTAPPKTVMGARLPAIPADEAPRSVSTTAPSDAARSAQPAPQVVAAPLPDPPRSFSPSGNARIQTPWGSMSAPGPVFLLALLIVGVLVGIVWFVRGEVRSIRDELAALDARAKARDDDTQRQLGELRLHLAALQGYTEQSVGLTAQVVRQLGGKLEFAPGTAPNVDFHPPPLHVGRAPVVQPRAVLPPPPPPP